VLADAPLGYWRLGEASGAAMRDELGLRDGAYSGGPLLGQPGALLGDPDAAAQFNGAGAYASVPYSAALNPGVFSAEAWAHPTGGSGAYRGVLGSRAYPAGWVLYAGADDTWQFWLNSGAAMLALRGPPVVLNRWTHLVGTFDGTTARLYVDGALRASGAVASYTPNAAQPLTVGQGPPDNGFWFPGRIDEAALYGAALSPARVQAHYATATTGQ
jgi:hypothetical protein